MVKFTRIHSAAQFLAPDLLSTEKTLGIHALKSIDPGPDPSTFASLQKVNPRARGQGPPSSSPLTGSSPFWLSVEQKLCSRSTSSMSTTSAQEPNYSASANSSIFSLPMTWSLRF